MSQLQPTPVRQCVPAQGIYCLPLARRVRGVISKSGGFGFIGKGDLSKEDGFVFENIGYKVPFTADPGIALNYCPFCGQMILREPLPA